MDVFWNSNGQFPQHNDFNTGANWHSLSPPTYLDTAVFNNTTTTSIVFSHPETAVGGWWFNFAPYTFVLAFDHSLSFYGNGIQGQIVYDGLVTIQNAGNINFFNGSIAGLATITSTEDGSVAFKNTSRMAGAEIHNGGRLDFFDTSSAASGTIDDLIHGTVIFHDQSKADASSITIHGALGFYDESSASNSNIEIMSQGEVAFAQESKAGTANITNSDTVWFVDKSTADHAAITNNDSLFFYQSSRAGKAEILNHADLNFRGDSLAGSAAGKVGATIANPDGIITFLESSSAANAEITNNQSLIFKDSSNAGIATIINGQTLEFTDHSTAASAAITNNAVLKFTGNSTAGDARLKNGSAGTIDFSATAGMHGDHRISVGALTGGGSVLLGSNTLAVGGGNLSGTFGGVISGAGMLVKAFNGTLTLTGDNLYAGGTLIEQGTLKISGSILNATTVEKGGTLAGEGQVGAVNVKSGGTLSTGTGLGRLETGALLLEHGSHFVTSIGGATPGVGPVTGTVKLLLPTLDASLLSGLQPSNTAHQTSVIIDNDATDAVVGTFAGLAEGATTLIDNRFFTISYRAGDGNDVALTSAGARIKGTDGADTVNGKSTIAGQPKATAFHDEIYGLGGKDNLAGLAGDDMLNGGSGNDVIAGGAGSDILTGGIGQDEFRYISASDSGKHHDTITDFRHQQDTISFSEIKLPKGAQFVLIGDHKFKHNAGEIQFIENDLKGTKHDHTMVNVDLDGDGKAELQIELTGLVNLDRHDFNF